VRLGGSTRSGVWTEAEDGLPFSHREADSRPGRRSLAPGTETAAGVARDPEENHVRDGDAERPVLSEMAEKLRRARSAGFHDFEQEPDVPEAPRAARPAETVQRREEPVEPAPLEEERDTGGGSGSLQASLRLDSIERRLFELRAALDELAAGQSDMPPDGDGHTPTDAEAWIAFAAAAVRRSDDAGAQAAIADQLLAEYRKRRASGGVLSGDE
jgi:hypothetical protein